MSPESSEVVVGSLVRVRARTYLVQDVRAASGTAAVVDLACIDDDAQGQKLSVIWSSEIDAKVIPAGRSALRDSPTPDDPKVFSAYLHALKWGCVTSTDPSLFQAPLRAGIVPKNYQLEPLRKALALPRVNLFIADDVGLGKTIEAGLVLQELLLRQRVHRVVVSCPASVVLQWRDELAQRFGLGFVIMDKAYVNARRRERGFGVNPWTTHRQFLISHALLRDEDYLVGLREWLGGFSAGSLLILDEARFADITEKVAALLERDFEPRTPLVPPSSWAAAALGAWVSLLFVAIAPDTDIEHASGEAYSPGTRDDAQQFRSRCLARLAGDPSTAARKAACELARAREMAKYQGTAQSLLDAQQRNAAEHFASRWSEADVLAVEGGDARTPRATSDLFDLVRRHLGRVARLVENDDFSYAALFGEKTPENDIQCWVASSLELVSRGLYTIEREPQVQDDKRIDISAAVSGVGRVPVEIKPLYAKRYTYKELEDFVSKQLLGRYMRPPHVDRGIFLLVPLKVRTWRVDGRNLTFEQMRTKLQAHARGVAAAKFKDIVVMSIDIATARDNKLKKVAPRTAGGLKGSKRRTTGGTSAARATT